MAKYGMLSTQKGTDQLDMLASTYPPDRAPDLYLARSGLLGTTPAVDYLSLPPEEIIPLPSAKLNNSLTDYKNSREQYYVVKTTGIHLSHALPEIMTFTKCNARG